VSTETPDAAAAAERGAAFAVIETRSQYALLPTRLLRSRDRSGAFGRWTPLHQPGP
jgi:hypothetical protein